MATSGTEGDKISAGSAGSDQRLQDRSGHPCSKTASTPGGGQFPGTSPAGNRPGRHIFFAAKLTKTFFFEPSQLQARSLAFVHIKKPMPCIRITWCPL